MAGRFVADEVPHVQVESLQYSAPELYLTVQGTCPLRYFARTQEFATPKACVERYWLRVSFAGARAWTWKLIERWKPACSAFAIHASSSANARSLAATTKPSSFK